MQVDGLGGVLINLFFQPAAAGFCCSLFLFLTHDHVVPYVRTERELERVQRDDQPSHRISSAREGRLMMMTREVK